MKAIGIILAAMAGTVGLLFLGQALDLWTITRGGEGHAAGTFLKRAPPREFLYLDTGRSEAYLSQLDGGLTKIRNITESSTKEGGGELSVTPAKVTAKVTRANSSDTQFAQTATSTFQALWERLGTLGQLNHLDVFKPDPTTGVPVSVCLRGRVVVRMRDTRVARVGCAVIKGDFVKVKLPDATQAVRSGCVRGPRAPMGNSVFARTWCAANKGSFVTFKAMVRKPLFVQVYLKLRYAEKYGRLHREGRALLARIGGQPRLPLVAAMRIGDTGRKAVHVVLPVQANLLAPEPTLYSAQLRVLAKVVRRIDHHAFGHLGFYARFRPMLWHRFAGVRAHLGVNTRHLRRALMGEQALQPPATLLLPVAIFN